VTVGRLKHTQSLKRERLQRQLIEEQRQLLLMEDSDAWREIDSLRKERNELKAKVEAASASEAELKARIAAMKSMRVSESFERSSHEELRQALERERERSAELEKRIEEQASLLSEAIALFKSDVQGHSGSHGLEKTESALADASGKAEEEKGQIESMNVGSNVLVLLEKQCAVRA